MKIFELAEQLKRIYDKHGDIEVMFSDDDGKVWAIDKPDFMEVESDYDYPRDWNMPKGFKFVRLHN